jgi:uncharacterized tellurite resistance protein B-like protein
LQVLIFASKLVQIIKTMEKIIKEQLAILIQLAYADEEFTDIERNTILKIGIEKGVPALEIELLFQDHKFTNLATFTKEQKTDVLLSMLTVLLSDTHIHPSEEKFAQSMAEKLGFKPSVINFLVDYHNMDTKVLREMVMPYKL